MARSFLESTFLTACPSFRPAWDAQRRAYPPGETPGAAAFLASLHAHLLLLLAEGRIVELAQVLRTVERLLGEADPILADLLADELVRPLAASVAAQELSPALVQPHLGPRTRRLWDTG